MPRRLALVLILLLSLFLPRDTWAESWEAGLAARNITPPKLMWMAGYGSRDHPAEGKLTDLWAKALAIRAGDHSAVLISLDLVGIDRELSQRICQTLEQEFDLQRDQISICTSHTHAGPAVGRNLGPLHYLQVDEEQQRLIDQYADFLHDAVKRVVSEALDNRRPCRLEHGQGLTTFAVNRRENPAGEVEQRRAEGTLKGPFDHDVPVLAVRDAADDSLVGVVFGYACHATTLSFYQWCGDYPGFAQQQLQERHPGCVAMFWAGCGADQNPLPRRTVELAKKYGGMLADAVDRVLDGKLKPVAPQLVTRYQQVALPLASIPDREHWVAMTQSKNRFEQARARMLLERIDAGKPLAKTYPYPIQCWRLGDITWLLLGGEVVVDYALQLKTEHGGERPVWVAGYANDVMAYIPSRRVLREGGYEGGSSMVYYGLPTVWAPELEATIMKTAADLVTTRSDSDD